MTLEASHPFGGHGWQATRWHEGGGAGLPSRLGRARRHSRFVRFLRFGIPTVLIVAGSLYALVGYLNPFSAIPNFDIAGLITSRSRLSMDRPRIAGYTRDGRAYELTASMALQDLRRPHSIELKGIKGKVEMPDGEIVSIVADEALYDIKGETAVLRQNVVVITTDGTEVRMDEAKVDARSGRVISDRSVNVLSQNGRLNAQQMEVQEGGKLMTFRGGVVMDFDRPRSAQQEALP